MRAVVTRAAGGPQVLELQTRDLPILRADQVLIKVVATCTNKIDLLERKEKTNVILGHECSGYIAEVGANVTGWQINDPVCALLRGSGYAEYVAVPSSFVFRIPRNISVEVASSLPFLTCSGFQAIGELKEGKTLLIHDGLGFGEVGLFAMLVAKALYKTKVFVVSVRESVLRRFGEYKADYCFEIVHHDYPKEVCSLTDKQGVDVILNYGGSRIAECQRCLGVGGFMMVVFDVQKEKSLDTGIDILRRFSNTIEIFDLRHFVSSWSQEELSALVEKVKEQVWPLFEDGRLTYEPRRTIMSLCDAAAAHKRMEKEKDEKIILTMEEKKKPLEKLTSLFRAMLDSYENDSTASRRKIE